MELEDRSLLDESIRPHSYMHSPAADFQELGRASVLEDERGTARPSYFCCKNLCEKWRITLTGATWGFLTSVERAIIVPTMWLYLTNYWSKSVAEAYYGATIASFGLAVLICTPLFGLIVHKGISLKIILIISNQLEILGNVIYVVAPQPWLLIVGRLICGIGASIEPPLYADLIAATRPEERTLCIIIFLISRQFGLMFGPGCTLLLHKLSFTVGKVSVSVYNSPGLVMACAWILHTVLVICIYPPGVNKKLLVNAAQSSSQESLIGEAKEVKLFKSSSLCKKTCHRTMGIYGRFNSIAVFMIIFATYLSVMGLEAVLSPVADRHFDWSEVEISFVYLGASVLILIVCGILHILSKKFEDRQLILCSLVVLTFAYFWQTIVTALLPWMQKSLGIGLLLTGVTLHVIAVPFPLALSESLYTKLIPVHESHRAQSILRTVINVAYMIGLALGGALSSYPYTVFLLMLLLMAIPTCMMTYRFEEFKVPSDAPSTESEPT